MAADTFSVSPDEKKVAFLQYLNGVYIMDIDGSNIMNIDDVYSKNTLGFEWSKNSKQFIYQKTIDIHDGNKIYICNYDGTGFSFLANGIKSVWVSC